MNHATSLSVTLTSRNIEASEEFYDLFELEKITGYDYHNPCSTSYCIAPGCYFKYRRKQQLTKNRVQH